MQLDWGATIGLIKDVWWILSVPLAVLMGVGMYYLRGQFPTKAEYEAQTQALQGSIGALSERIAGNERKVSDRVTKLESELHLLPSRSEVQALGERIGRVEKEVATSVEAIRGVEKTVSKIDHTLSMILDHLLQQKAPSS
jgi:predicted  nucleic acid-binding Zn-ribbon protein